MEIYLVYALVALILVSTVQSELCEITVGSRIKWSRHPDDCSTAYMCLLGKVVSYTCPDGYVVSSDDVSCIPAGSQYDDCTELERIILHDVEITPLKIASSCKEGSKIQDETNCALFSECVALPDYNTTMVSQECTYPFLFNVKSGKCEHFKDVKCDPGQIVPKSPCDYMHRASGQTQSMGWS